MSITADINSLVKIKKIKQKLPVLGTRSEIVSSRGVQDPIIADEDSSGIVNPVEFIALTYDDTKDVVITDDSAVVQTFKTVATAKIVDANGKEILIDTVTFTDPP